MLTATKYLGSAGAGATRPQLFRADDGNIYVVKLQNNRLGTKVLANEYLAVRLGECLSLKFPPGGLIYLSPELIASSRRLRAARVPAGLHFACQYLRGTRYVDRSGLYRAVNKSELAGVMLFDYMFHNLDRTWNRKNLLLRREQEGYKIYAIDNSHLFRRGRWSTALLEVTADKIMINYRRSYGWLLKHFLSDEDFFPYAHKVRLLTDDTVRGIVADIPQEWLPDNEEREALVTFITKRRDMVDTIVNKLVSLIPNEHRRAHRDEIK